MFTILPDLSGTWLWEEDSISFENPETFKVVQEINTYNIRFDPVDQPSDIKPLTYRFYVMYYLDGPYADYPVVVIQYKTSQGIFFQGAESVDTGLSTVQIKCIKNSRATRMEGIYQESGFLQDVSIAQVPKVGYSVFTRLD